MKTLLERWINFLKINEDTIACLNEFSTIVEPHLNGITHVFYERLVESEAASVFKTPDSLARALHAQKQHWMKYVLCGRFDTEYLAATRAIGRAHHRIGVDIMFYTGAYSVLLNELNTLISAIHHDQPDLERRTRQAVQQAVFLDMGLATTVYYESVGLAEKTVTPPAGCA